MIQRCKPLLGTFVEVTADREDAIEAAFAAVAKVHRLMSAHEADSDVSRINRFGHLRSVEVHEWTARVIERALFWSRMGKGAFDVVRAGKGALERRLIPQHQDQPKPEAAHWTWLEIQGRSVRLLKTACTDLGGIAKGFAVDRALDVLREAGCERGLVNAGGDVRGFGPKPWPVSIVDPLSRSPIAEVALLNEALATSQGLPDPSGGLSFDHVGGKSRWVSVSVVAGTACDADALTKIVWTGMTNFAGLFGDGRPKALVMTTDGKVQSLGELAKVAA